MKNTEFSLLIPFLVLGMAVYASVAVAQQYNFTLDFEVGSLSGWTAEGDAFLYQPTLDDNPTARRRGETSNHQGRYWIGTFERYQGRPGQEPGGVQGDGPVGTLTSASFVIPKGTLSFLIGGGSSFETRVELLIEDPIEGRIGVRQATGRDTETMHRESWDLTPYAGRTGRLRIVDASSGGWGHINADDFQFSSGMVTLDGSRSRVARLDETRPKVPEPTIRPTAIIKPGYREVAQGENAEFESLSSPSGMIIQETWTGPYGQAATGSRFTINTKGIGPGSYRIELSVIDRYKQTYGAIATLVVVPPRQVAPEAQPKARYRVELTASPEIIEIGQNVRFIASLGRELRGAEFNFDFGDGTTSAWITEPEIVHQYSLRGELSAFVTVRRAREMIARSTRVRIRVTESLPRLTLSLHPDNESPYIAENILFRAELSRPLPDARYQFSFGDFIVSEWTPNPEIEHSYGREGTYRAQGLVRVDREKTIESLPVTIMVQKRPQRASRVQIKPDKKRVQTQTAITFAAILTPPDNEAEYNFLFGDATESGWQSSAESVHAYAQAGEYSVKVAVRKNEDMISESEGTIITVLRPSPPEKDIEVFLSVAPLVAVTGETVKFTAVVSPPGQTMEYRIVFGDGNMRAWDKDPAAEHIYARAGSYRPYVSVRFGQQFAAESRPVEVEISARPQPPPPQPPPGPSPPPLDGTLRTIMIIGTAVVIFTAGYLARHFRKGKKRDGLKETVHSFQAVPHLAPGEQLVGSGHRLDLEYELQIRHVTDRGTQEIAADGPLFADEDHGSKEER